MSAKLVLEAVALLGLLATTVWIFKVIEEVYR